MTYRLFDKGGQELGRKALAKRLADAEVILFGEQHGHPSLHALQLQLSNDLFELKQQDLALGTEMFEVDNQLILDEYLGGMILHRHLVAEAKVWEGYENDYRPLVEFARERGLRFLATNIPRRYANLVAREGLASLDRLSQEARGWMAPLPIAVDLDTPGYREMLGMNLGMGHGMPREPMNFVAAQAVKDATMAHFIVKNRAPGRLLLHFNGDYHSKNYGGIFWYLRQAEPALTVRTISCVTDDSLAFSKGYGSLADFVVVAPPA